MVGRGHPEATQLRLAQDDAAPTGGSARSERY